MWTNFNDTGCSALALTSATRQVFENSSVSCKNTSSTLHFSLLQIFLGNITSQLGAQTDFYEENQCIWFQTHLVFAQKLKITEYITKLFLVSIFVQLRSQNLMSRTYIELFKIIGIGKLPTPKLLSIVFILRLNRFSEIFQRSSRKSYLFSTAVLLFLPFRPRSPVLHASYYCCFSSAAVERFAWYFHYQLSHVLNWFSPNISQVPASFFLHNNGFSHFQWFHFSNCIHFLSSFSFFFPVYDALTKPFHSTWKIGFQIVCSLAWFLFLFIDFLILTVWSTFSLRSSQNNQKTVPEIANLIACVFFLGK